MLLFLIRKEKENGLETLEIIVWMSLQVKREFTGENILNTP